MIKKGLILLLIGTSMLYGNKIDSLYSKQEKIAYSTLDRIGKKFFYKYGLEPSGVGGNMNEDVKTLFLGLSCNKEANINDARKLIVVCAKEYMFESLLA